jgi:hypothetical protein
MIEILTIKIALFSILFVMACYFVGNPLPNGWLMSQTIKSLHRLLIGFSATIIIFWIIRLTFNFLAYKFWLFNQYPKAII